MFKIKREYEGLVLEEPSGATHSEDLGQQFVIKDEFVTMDTSPNISGIISFKA